MDRGSRKNGNARTLGLRRGISETFQAVNEGPYGIGGVGLLVIKESTGRTDPPEINMKAGKGGVCELGENGKID